MSSVLSEIKNSLEASSIKDTVMNMFNKVKDVFLKDPEILPMKEPVKDVLSKDPEILPMKETVKKEGYEDPLDKTPKSAIEIIQAIGINIKNTTWEYVVQWGTIIIYIYLACLVANDMIIYAPPIRAVFFVFTLVSSIYFLPYAVLVGLYYLILKGYDLYNYHLSSVDPKPSKSFPMVFAILPLTTYYSDSQFVRFLLWAFAYQKSPNDDKRMTEENVRLEEVMTKYWNDLNSSFEYIAKIEKTPPFSTFRGIIKEKLTVNGMHPIQIKGYPFPKQTDPSITPNVGKTGATGVTEEKKEQVQFFIPKGLGQEKREEEKKIEKENKKKEEEEAEKERKRIKAAQPAPMPETLEEQKQRREKEEAKKQAPTSTQAAPVSETVIGQIPPPVQGYAQPAATTAAATPAAPPN